jgi:glucose/arabinose dehydrogenase
MRSLARTLLPTVTALSALAATASTAPAASLSVLARNLAQPKKLTVAPNGDLIVALSGDGVAPKSSTDGDQSSCLDRSGAVDAVTPAGTVIRLVSELPSISSGHNSPQATGPCAALYANGGLHVLFQNTVISPQTGAEIYGSRGSLLGSLSTFSLNGALTSLDARLGPFEAARNPDRSSGTGVKYGAPGIDSDPYGIVAYRGGYAIADAGANDVVWVSPSGTLSLLAALPTIGERAAAGAFAKSQTKTLEAQAQSVPTSLAVGPDGALYVGELGGVPGLPGKSSVYRIAPGQRTRVYASGLSAIEDLAFDPQGRLLVLELDKKGLADPGVASNTPASGAVIRIADGTKSTLMDTGLTFPTGMAVTAGGAIYLTVNGVSSKGELVRVEGVHAR